MQKKTFRSRNGSDLLKNSSLNSNDLSSFESADIQPPSMFHYLPHLSGKKDALRPALKMSNDRFGGTIKMLQKMYICDYLFLSLF